MSCQTLKTAREFFHVSCLEFGNSHNTAIGKRITIRETTRSFVLMIEIEAKILEINKMKVEERLVKLGSRKVFDGEMESFFYDFKDGLIVKSKNVMRLRRENKNAILTYKIINENREAKIAEEYSVVVSDLGIMQKILQSLGFVLIESMQKHRTSYELEGVHFDIDCYAGKYNYIPEFLEIEADSIGSVYRYARKLGFKAEDCLPWSTVQVVEHYKKRKD
jgi:adenylate cyclase class 2